MVSPSLLQKPVVPSQAQSWSALSPNVTHSLLAVKPWTTTLDSLSIDFPLPEIMAESNYGSSLVLALALDKSLLSE